LVFRAERRRLGAGSAKADLASQFPSMVTIERAEASGWSIRKADYLDMSRR